MDIAVERYKNGSQSARADYTGVYDGSVLIFSAFFLEPEITADFSPDPPDSVNVVELSYAD